MKGRTKSKGIGIAAILVVALLAATGLSYADGVQPGDVQPLSTQWIDITTKEVTLYDPPDALDNTGEIYVRYNTDISGDVDKTTGTQEVLADGNVNTWTATPNSWDDKPYAADSLRIRIYDDDLLSSDDKLYDQYHSLSIGDNLVTSKNNDVKVKTEVTVHNP